MDKLIKWGYFIACIEEILVEDVARIYIIIILCLTSDTDPYWAHADYSLYTCGGNLIIAIDCLVNLTIILLKLTIDLGIIYFLNALPKGVVNSSIFLKT